MSPPAPSPHDPSLAASGRVLTLASLLGLFVLSNLPFLAGVWQGQAAGAPPAGVARGVLYVTLTAALLTLVWQGRVWAWRLTVSLSVVAGLVVFVLGMLTVGAGVTGWVISAAGLAYLGLGVALVGTPAIRAFLDSRWGRQTGKSQPEKSP